MSDTKIMNNHAAFDTVITTTEMHTGGGPVRIIESGYPIPKGDAILDKIEDLKKNHEDFRKMVIWEPRGHFDMFGVLLVTPDHPEADIAVVFLHNEGYIQMCGHAVVSVGRYAVDRGMLKRPITSPSTRINIQAPCGLVRADVQVDNGVRTGRVCFESVPAFVVETDLELDVPYYGKIKIDVAYGGAFYAFVTAKDIEIDFKISKASDIMTAATAIKAVAKDQVELSHPENPAYLCGVIVIDSRTEKSEGCSTNVCIFADSQTDRSPCGSGTTARVALMYHRGLLALGERHVFQSGVTGSEFVAWPEQEKKVDGQEAITVKIEGQGFYTGSASLSLEKEDVFGRGLLIR